MLRSLLKGAFQRKGDGPGFMDSAELPYFDAKQLGELITQKAKSLATAYIDWPWLVHMETIAVCNAACDFCPYPTLARKGERMPDALIEKIIHDLEDIPSDVPFQLAPYKVSDPLLEPRLFDILKLVNARLPNANISIITNGAALTERNLERLSAVKKVFYLTVSLNYDNAEEYEAVMKIPFARTLKRIDHLHERTVSGNVAMPVRLTRVSDNKRSDTLFLRWTKARYPAFEIGIVPFHDTSRMCLFFGCQGPCAVSSRNRRLAMTGSGRSRPARSSRTSPMLPATAGSTCRSPPRARSRCAAWMERQNIRRAM